MLKLACDEHEGLVPDDSEIRRPGASFTVQTLEAVHAERPAVDPIGERLTAFGRAVDDHHVADTGAVERDGDSLAHRPGADQGDVTPGHAAVMLDRHLDGGGACALATHGSLRPQGFEVRECGLISGASRR